MELNQYPKNVMEMNNLNYEVMMMNNVNRKMNAFCLSKDISINNMILVDTQQRKNDKDKKLMNMND
jgi:hypothetical protein